MNPITELNLLVIRTCKDGFGRDDTIEMLRKAIGEYTGLDDSHVNDGHIYEALTDAFAITSDPNTVKEFVRRMFFHTQTLIPYDMMRMMIGHLVNLPVTKYKV